MRPFSCVIPAGTSTSLTSRINDMTNIHTHTHHGGYETAEVRGVRISGEGRGLRGGPGKIMYGVSPGRPQRFRDQRRPVDDCSPERGGTALDGGTRAGTFHGKMYRCKES